MEGEFIPYEQALALKELGFNEPCLGYYVGKDKEVYMSNEILSAPFQFRLESKTTFVAQTFSQAFRWFREKYNLHSTIALISNSDTERRYMVMIDYIYPHKAIMEFEEYETHEEAEIECIKKLIKIIKNKQL